MSLTQSAPAPAIARQPKRLNSQQRVQIKTLRDLGMSQQNIADRLGVTIDQVRYTLTISYLEPKKSTGRPPKLSSQEVDQIQAFITSTPEAQQMSWHELAAGPFQHLGVGENVIQRELRKRGYGRDAAAPKKPPLSAKKRRKRVQQAEIVKDSTGDNLTSTHRPSEAQVADYRPKREWVTRKIGEKVYIT